MNIIRKQSVNFRYNGNIEGFYLQREVLDWCRNILNPSITGYLETFERSEVISIDTIRLDVNLSDANWKEYLAGKIISELKEKLQNISSEARAIGIDSVSRNYQVLIYYLKHGILPWYATITSKSELESSINEWISNASSTEIKELVRELGDKKPVQRLLKLLGSSAVELLVTAILKTEDDSRFLLDDIKTIASAVPDEKFFGEKLLNVFAEKFIIAVASQQEPGIALMVRNWLSEIIVKYEAPVEEIQLLPVKGSLIKRIISEMIESGTPVKEKHTGEKLQGQHPRDNMEYAGDGSDAVLMNAPGTILQEALADGVFLHNAGAVIIAAFLPALFSRTGLLHENRITRPDIALSLVHYCITGTTEAAEFELLFPKILCGIDPETVAHTTQLNDKDLLWEADEMLASVIEYWSVLKDTSHAVLQAEFLQRSGKLSFVKDEWWLQVEQKPFDIVLEQLPWNISRIKLPWMEYLLKTDWI